MTEYVRLNIGDVIREGDERMNTFGEWERAGESRIGKIITPGFADYRRPCGPQPQAQPQEPAETELERKAWEIFIWCDRYQPDRTFEIAQEWINERDKRRTQQ